MGYGLIIRKVVPLAEVFAAWLLCLPCLRVSLLTMYLVRASARRTMVPPFSKRSFWPSSTNDAADLLLLMRSDNARFCLPPPWVVCLRLLFKSLASAALKSVKRLLVLARYSTLSMTEAVLPFNNSRSDQEVVVSAKESNESVACLGLLLRTRLFGLPTGMAASEPEVFDLSAGILAHLQSAVAKKMGGRGRPGTAVAPRTP
mmetsp:Transcript_4059/g.9147  ORF Transcript_4059/g.9147 Transcript_4059/m.9147 type:complete len:202 (+) Transcript_4059:271-876(+)